MTTSILPVSPIFQVAVPVQPVAVQPVLDPIIALSLYFLSPHSDKDKPHGRGSGPKRYEKDRRWTRWFWAVLGEYNHPLIVETSQELGNCPIGQREALLKERLYQRKALLVKIVKFGQNCEIWSNL